MAYAIPETTNGSVIVLEPTQQPSTFENIKQGVVDAGNWVGRQVTWFVNSVKHGASKVIDSVKPFFSRIAEFVSEQAHRLRDFIVANKEVSIAFGVGVPVVAALTLLAYWAICDKREVTAKTVVTTETTTPVVPATATVTA